MPVVFRVEPERSLIVATATGTVTLEELQAYVTAVLTHPEVEPGFDELLDLRQTTEVAFPTLDLGSVIETVRKVDQAVKQTKSAAVASPENEAAITPLYRLLRDVLPNEVRLFVDWDAAREWLSLGEDTQELRDAPRKSILLHALCRSGINQGSGRLVNISLSGALIELVALNEIRLDRGRLVRLRVFSPELEEVIELTGTVVRRTEIGFAIQFVNVTEQLRRLVGAY